MSDEQNTPDAPNEADSPGSVGTSNPQYPKGVLGPVNEPTIENATWWAVLTPTAQGKFAWLTLGGEQPVLYGDADKARSAASGIQGASVYPVVVGIGGPALSPAG